MNFNGSVTCNSTDDGWWLVKSHLSCCSDCVLPKMSYVLKTKPYVSWCLGSTILLALLLGNGHQACRAWLLMLQHLVSPCHLHEPSNGHVWGNCACPPHQHFYKRDVHHIPRLTFWLTVGWDISCTTALPISTHQASCSS